MSSLVAQRYIPEMSHNTHGRVVVSTQAVPSIPSPPPNYIILRNVVAKPASLCSQSATPSSSSESTVTIPTTASSGNDHDPVMLTHRLSKPSFGASTSGQSSTDASQVMTKHCATRRHLPRFISASTCTSEAEDRYDVVSPSNLISTNAGHLPSTNSTSAIVSSCSVQEKLVPGPHPGSLSFSVQAKSHDKIAHTSDPLLSVEPASDFSTLGTANMQPLIVRSDAAATIQQEADDNHQQTDIQIAPSLPKVRKSFASTSVRRSSRVNREDHLPLGPRHLELEYHEAWEQLRYVTLKVVFDLGYDCKKMKAGRSVLRTTPPTVREIMAMKIPSVLQARRRVDEADRRLNDALARGFTWDNTPVPQYRVVEDEKGNILEVILVKDPLASHPADPSMNLKQTGKRGTKRKHDLDADLEHDQAKRRCFKASTA